MWKEASSPVTPPSPGQPHLRSPPPPAKESQQPKKCPPPPPPAEELMRTKDCSGVNADLGQGWSWPWWRRC